MPTTFTICRLRPQRSYCSIDLLLYRTLHPKWDRSSCIRGCWSSGSVDCFVSLPNDWLCFSMWAYLPFFPRSAAFILPLAFVLISNASFFVLFFKFPKNEEPPFLFFFFPADFFYSGELPFPLFPFCPADHGSDRRQLRFLTSTRFSWLVENMKHTHPYTHIPVIPHRVDPYLWH